MGRVIRFLLILCAVFFTLGFVQRSAAIQEARAKETATYLRLP